MFYGVCGTLSLADVMLFCHWDYAGAPGGEREAEG